MRRVALTLLLTLLVLVAGCSAGSSPAEITAPGAPQATAGSGDMSAGEQTNPMSPNDVPNPSGQQVTKNATVTLKVDDIDSTASKIRQLATSNAGLVFEEQLSHADEGNYSGWNDSYIIIQVPAEKLDASLDQLASFGEVRQRTVTTTDVTMQMVDIEARITSQQQSVNRVLAMMDQATTVAELVQVENELNTRQTELESLKAQQAALSQAVNYSPIHIVLVTSSSPIVQDGPFITGLKQGWEAFGMSIQVLVTVLGAALPFLVIAAAITIPLMWRARKRSAARRAGLVAPPRPPAPPTAPVPSGPPTRPSQAPSSDSSPKL